MFINKQKLLVYWSLKFRKSYKRNAVIVNLRRVVCKTSNYVTGIPIIESKFQNSHHSDSFINGVAKPFNEIAIKSDYYIKPLSLFEA